jgi:hypothetical protein
MLVYRVFKKIRSAWCLPLREKIWLLLLYPYSGLVRAAILVFPFRLLARCLGQHHQNYQLSPLVSESQQKLAWRIGQITELTARYTPWKSQCLVQAIMAKSLLGFYRVPYVVHLGAKMTTEAKKPMKAHAWVKVGPRVITGREGHKTFGIVSSFVAPSVLN